MSDQAPFEFRVFTLFNEIGIIEQLTRTAFERVLPDGLTQAQFTVLNHCVRLGDGRTPAAIAEALQVTRATMTSTLKKLEAKALVSIVPDEHDGRSKRVFLTEAGRHVRGQAIADVLPVLSRLEGVVSEEDLAELLPRLLHLRQWLDNNRD